MPDERRVYAPESKAAVKLVTGQGRSVAEAARSLGITEKLLRKWKLALASKGPDASPGHGNPPAAQAGLRRLQEESKRLRAERDTPKNLRRSSPGVAVISPFIQANTGSWPVTVMAEALEVSAAGFYAWRDRPSSVRQQRRDALVVEISAVHAEARGRHGSPRVHAELRARGHGCCVNTVAEVMRQAGIRAKAARKFRHTTDSNHGRPVADNVLSREFDPSGPNEAWVADITYIPTREGWLYLAAVEDLYSRRVVGWSMDSTMTSRLVVDTLERAVKGRLAGEGLVAHSDRGSQYASEHYQRLLGRHGIGCSMSGVGRCWDNAPMESFFASLKKELVHDEDYRTREEAKASIFEYIEAFSNRQRRHSTLGYVSPAECEQPG